MGVRGTEFVVACQAPDSLKTLNKAINGQVLSQPNAQAAAPPPTQITVVQGSVAVAKTEKELNLSDVAVAKGTAPTGIVSLGAGQQLTSNSTTASIAQAQVVSVPPAALATLASSATSHDNTFSKAVVLDLSSAGAAANNNNNNSSSSTARTPSSSTGPAAATAAGASAAPQQGSGAVTIGEVSTAIANNSAPSAPVAPNDVSIPGTFGASNPITNAPFVRNTIHTVTINVHTTPGK
jgi:hypothetical protein